MSGPVMPAAPLALRRPLRWMFMVLAAAGVAPALAEPTVVSSTVLGPFTGAGAKLHPRNVSPHHIRYYGTDLGFTYLHDGDLHILFGDTWATEAYAPIEASTGAAHDDGFGIVDPEHRVEPALIAPNRIPLIELGQHADSREMAAMDPGHDMSLGKTPMAGFSNGTRQYALFNLTKPQGCRVDAECGTGLVCDTGLGYIGTPYHRGEGLTLPCVDGSSPFCTAATQADGAAGDSGFCVDTTSTVRADSEAGRTTSIAYRVRVGTRSQGDPRIYSADHDWLSNKFGNVTATTVQDFVPERGSSGQDYRTASAQGGQRRLLLWGRPGFVGVGARGRSLGLYLAYVDLPAGPGYPWQVRYFTGSDDEGVPRFSSNQAHARPVDLNSDVPGSQPGEVHDVVQQMTVAWIEPLGKWVMLYGGGVSRLPKAAFPRCGVLEIFARGDCGLVDLSNGAVRLRTANHPWGPWSPPRDVLVGGDPEADPPGGQYAPGGMLHHPACAGETCAPHTRSEAYLPDEYGFLYSANIIEPWTRTVEDGVEIFWNASTWDPYRVILVKTHIRR